MTDGVPHPGLARLLGDREVADVLDVLRTRISGADLTTLLMAVARDRADGRAPSDVLEQYGRDRFVAPGSVDPRQLRAIEDLAIDAAGPPFELTTLSPVVPLGTHSVVAGVSQNNVLTTMRATEVAADPTTALALEAAVRRRALLDDDPRSSVPVHLAALQRVVRAQRMDGAQSFAHFSLIGLVTAGRDSGNHSFEVDAIVEHVRVLAAVARRAGAVAVRVLLTDLDGRFGPAIDRVAEALDGDDLETVVWPERRAGTGYYPDLCFKLVAQFEGAGAAGDIEVGDGGAVMWTQRLLQNRKERLMISGLGLDRLASAANL